MASTSVFEIKKTSDYTCCWILLDSDLCCCWHHRHTA